jgi:hypothetical protein
MIIHQLRVYLGLALLILLNIIDAHTTQILITHNPILFSENNPVMDFVIKEWGWTGLVISKAIPLTLMIALLHAMETPYIRMIYVLILLYAAIVLRSLMLIYLNF